MRRRLLATAVAGIALAPGSAAAGVAEAAPGHSERGTRGPAGSAYGLSLTGPVPIEPMGAVSSAASEVRRTLVKENTHHVSLTAVDTRATARSANATISGLRVPPAQLSADVITAKCVGGQGTARLVNASVAGRALTSHPAPNSTVPVEIPGLGTARVTLNKQERLRDGRLSVTGMETDLPLGPLGLGSETLRTANAVCGSAGPAAETSEPSKPSKPKGTGGGHPFDGPASPAPKPSPVKGDLAVTG